MSVASRFLALWIVPALFFSSLSEGQQRRPAAENVSFLAQPFEAEVVSLPPHFRGHDATKLAELMAQKVRQLEKSEYETKSQHEERLAAAKSISLTPKLTFGSRLAFVLPLESNFDAEKGELMIANPFKESPEWQHQCLGPEHLRTAIVWRRSVVSGGSYVGTNAFGVKKLVSRRNVYQTIIEMNPPHWLQVAMGGDRGSLDPYAFEGREGVRFPMTAGEAMLFRNRLKAVAIGTLEAPFVAECVDSNDATIDDPVDEIVHSKQLHFHLQQVLLFDESTGRIVSHYSEDEYRHTWPLRLEITSQRPVRYNADGDSKARSKMGKYLMTYPLTYEHVYFEANKEITITMTDFLGTVWLNGVKCEPNWRHSTVDLGVTFVGAQTATIRIPESASLTGTEQPNQSCKPKAADAIIFFDNDPPFDIATYLTKRGWREGEPPQEYQNRAQRWRDPLPPQRWFVWAEAYTLQQERERNETGRR
jgi:hypothetical protein